MPSSDPEVTFGQVFQSKSTRRSDKTKLTYLSILMKFLAFHTTNAIHLFDHEHCFNLGT